MKTVKIRKAIAEDLALRDSADRFFDLIEAYSESRIIVDFAGISSISRSFAHQYIIRRAESAKEISETNLPENVEKMFRVVREPAPKPHLVNLSAMRVVTV